VTEQPLILSREWSSTTIGFGKGNTSGRGTNFLSSFGGQLELASALAREHGGPLRLELPNR
jgi:hypothetical protein